MALVTLLHCISSVFRTVANKTVVNKKLDK